MIADAVKTQQGPDKAIGPIHESWLSRRGYQRYLECQPQFSLIDSKGRVVSFESEVEVYRKQPSVVSDGLVDIIVYRLTRGGYEANIFDGIREDHILIS